LAKAGQAGESEVGVPLHRKGNITKRDRSSRKKTSTAEPARNRPRGRLWWCAAIIVFAGFLSYANSLSGPFILDDQSSVVDNRQIREWWRLATILRPESDSSVAGRPIVNLSFAVNYALGGLDVRGYHLVNVGIHVLCGLLVFGLVRRTLDLPRVRTHFSASSPAMALAVALLWVVHPLNSEVVDYLTQRTESMMAMFYLATLYGGVRAIGAERSSWWRFAAVLSCGAGMLCKESMVTAPLMAALYDRAYVFDSWRQALRRRRGFYLGLFATWLVLAAMMASSPRAAVAGFSSGVSPWTYLLNQAVIISHYLRLVIWPRSLVVFYGWPVPLTLGDVAPYALLIVALSTVAVLAWFRRPALGFLGISFFVALAPSSSFVPVATEVGAERRMYLPLVALVALAVVGTVQMWSAIRGRWPAVASLFTPRRRAVAGLVLLTLVAGALMSGTFARNREYSSALTLAQTVVDRRPTAVAHHVLAEQLMVAGRDDEAIAHLREATAGGDSRAAYQLGVLLFNNGRLGEAVEQLEAFVRTWGLPYRLVPRWLEPPAVDVIAARAALSRIFLMQSRWPEAAEQAQRILTMARSNVEARALLADARFGEQQFEEASILYREYLAARPTDVRALTNFGVTMIAAGQLDEAVTAFRRAVDVDPRSPNSRRLLTMALMDRGDFEAAAIQAREGVTLSPDDPVMRELLERARAGRSGR
jgi:protein O-mannosyl-transferase